MKFIRLKSHKSVFQAENFKKNSLSHGDFYKNYSNHNFKQF